MTTEYPTTTGTELDDDRLSSRDVVNSLTGFDELAIEKRFGRTVEDLAENTGTTFLRALLYAVERRRAGVSDQQAYEAAMSATFGGLQERFAPDDADADPDLPGSPAGEGPEPTGDVPTS